MWTWFVFTFKYSTKISTLTSQYDQIATERNDLKLKIYNHEKTIEKLKEEILSHPSVLKKQEEEILTLKAEIEKLQAEKSIDVYEFIKQKQSTVSLNQSENFLSFNEMDKYEEKVIKCIIGIAKRKYFRTNFIHE